MVHRLRMSIAQSHHRILVLPFLLYLATVEADEVLYQENRHKNAVT